jgi:hypothetical protein
MLNVQNETTSMLLAKLPAFSQYALSMACLHQVHAYKVIWACALGAHQCSLAFRILMGSDAMARDKQCIPTVQVYTCTAT